FPGGGRDPPIKRPVGGAMGPGFRRESAGFGLLRRVRPLMQPTSHDFPANARVGLGDPVLQRALGLARTGFPLRRQQAIERLPEFEALREEGRLIKDHTLAHLDHYLELYERNVVAAGGQVHWARDAAEAREAVLQICRAAGAKIVTKGKSMVAEEIAVN